MSASKHLIYGLRDPRDGAIRYVGKSSTGMKRPKAHSKRAASEQTHKAAWIRKLQAAGLQYEIVVLEQLGDDCSKDLINAREIAWIALGREALGDRLTNGSDGGDGFDSESARKMWASLSPEQRERRIEGVRKANASQTFEQHSERLQKAWASIPLERRREIALKRQASYSPEQRRERAQKISASQSKSQRSEQSKKMHAARTPERRSEISRKAMASLTPEQLREKSLKAWETRRARGTDRWQHTSITPEERERRAQRGRTQGIRMQAALSSEQRSERAQRAAQTLWAARRERDYLEYRSSAQVAA